MKRKIESLILSKSAKITFLNQTKLLMPGVDRGDPSLYKDKEKKKKGAAAMDTTTDYRSQVSGRFHRAGPGL